MSNRENTSPTKTCSNCGQQKPLSAFLEMSSEQGTTYGNICSTCRKITLEELQRRKKSDAEGSTTTDVGHNIDAEAKVQGEVDKRELVQRIDSEYHAERKENTETNKNDQQIKSSAEIGQRKHREDFLKQRSFLGANTNKDNKPSSTQQLRTEMLRGNEKDAQQRDNRFAEKLMTEHDFTVANHGQQVAGQLRFQGQTFQQFRQWLGNSAPIVNNLNQTKKDPQPAKPGAVAEDVTKTKATPKQEEAKKDPAVEFIENNWRPSGGRKR